jgi:hypothetical protein
VQSFALLIISREENIKKPALPFLIDDEFVLHPSQLVFVTMATTNQLDDDNNKTKNKK